MTNWKKVESMYGKEIEEIKKSIKNYDYSKKPDQTDEALRNLLAEKLKKARHTVSEMMEIAFRENIELFDIKRLGDELDIVVNEIQKSRFKVKSIDLVSFDAVLIKNSNIVAEATKKLYTTVLNSKVDSLEQEIRAIRKALIDVKSIFEDREKLLK